MPNILLTRIDNRLVHGQVGVTWTMTLGANLLLVANDKVVNDPLQQELMRAVADSSQADIRFMTLEKTASVIHKAADRQKIFIICRDPADVRNLIENGVPINEVNIGNMHFERGKKPLSKKVYVDDKDLEDLKYIQSQGIDLYIQDVPGDAKEHLKI